METLKVLSIDIGIINLGYVYAELDISLKSPSKYKAKLEILNFKQKITILDCNRVNITKVKHTKVSRCNCLLHHENCIPDYLDHFIQETPYFEECDVLILERQPPVGITNVQDLLFTKFRDKVVLISPVSVHKYFDLPSCNYELRKQKSEILAEDYLKYLDTFINNTRKHDISDAMLMIVYYYKLKMENIINYKHFIQNSSDFEQFRFVISDA